MIAFQLILDSTITLIGRFIMDFFYQCCNSSVFPLIFRYFTVQPFVVGSSGHPAQLTKCLYRIIVLFVFFFNCLIYRFMTNQAQPRLLSISSIFFRNDNSISARCRLAFSNFNSARSFSISVRESSGFLLPRLSCNAVTPPVSYLIV